MKPDVTLRAWARDDLPAMAGLINARLVAEGDEDEQVTVERMAEQYDHLVGCDPETDIIVATDAAGDVVGYGRTGYDDEVDGPRVYFLAFEGRPGVVEQMFAWALDRALTLVAADPHPNKEIGAYAQDGSARYRLLAGAEGFVPHSWAAVMVRPHLDDIGDWPLPDDVGIRPVRPADLRAVWEADSEAFRDHPGYIESTENDWTQFAEAARDIELWQVAWDADGIAGQVRTRVNEGEAERRGRRRAWTEDISTRRDRRGQGIASALIAASLHQLRELGFDEAALTVNLENPTGALKVYERMGYETTTRSTGFRRRV